MFNANFEELSKKELVSRLNDVENILYLFSQDEGAHHKAYCLDQIAHKIYQDKYDDFVHDYIYTDVYGTTHDEVLYDWDIGIAP